MTETSTAKPGDAFRAAAGEPKDGRVEYAGKTFLVNSKGRLIPERNVRPSDLLIDEMVRKIVGFAEPLSSEISRFKDHCFEDCNGLQALLDQEYGVTRGGTKGNLTFRTFDGLLMVTVQVADLISFGPELLSAKALLDECLLEWSADSRTELQSLITEAFDVEKSGGINRYAIFRLLRVQSEDERWNRAMEAIRASILTVGSKRYVRIQKREKDGAPWQSITLDMAAA